MNRDDLKKLLDVDRNSKVNIDDVVAFVNGSSRRLFAIGFALGFTAGAFVVRILTL